MKKKLTWIVLAVALLLVVGLGVLWLNLNGIVRAAVERGTGQSLALTTTLGSANVGLLSGDVALGELKVGNPAGFTAPHLLTLGGVSVDTSYRKVMGEPVAVNAIVIERPRLTIEFKGTQSNLKTVADNLAKTGQGEPAPTPSPTPPSPDEAKPKKVIIDDLKVSGAQVELISDLIGLKQTIDLPAIELKAIGNADGNRNGEEIGKVVSQLIGALTIEAQKSGKVPPELAAILNGDLNALVGQLGGAFQQQAEQLKAQVTQQVEQIRGDLQEKAKDAQQQAESKLNDAKKQAEEKLNKGLGDLLGGRKDEKK